MKTGSEVVLLNTGDWTEVYVNGKNAGLGGHSLSDYSWALLIRDFQPIESIVQREFVSKPDEEYWPYLNEWPADLTEIPEKELGPQQAMMEGKRQRVLEEPEGKAI